MFFFKRKPIVITSFISEDHSAIFEYSPIVPAQKVIPEWWRSMAPGVFDWAEMEGVTNAKSCIGIINTIRSGLILPLWCEVAIKTDESGMKYAYADRKSYASIHPNNQAPGFYDDYYVFKLHSPWMIKCSEDNINLHFGQPFYHSTSPLPYYTPPGIVSPTRKAYSTNIFIFLPKKIKNEYILEINTPLLQIIPMTDRKVEYKTEVLSASEFLKQRDNVSYRNVFLRKGIKRKLF